VLFMALTTVIQDMASDRIASQTQGCSEHGRFAPKVLLHLPSIAYNSHYLSRLSSFLLRSAWFSWGMIPAPSYCRYIWMRKIIILNLWICTVSSIKYLNSVMLEGKGRGLRIDFKSALAYTMLVQANDWWGTHHILQSWCKAITYYW
jgi:hypothetical protein